VDKLFKELLIMKDFARIKSIYLIQKLKTETKSIPTNIMLKNFEEEIMLYAGLKIE